MRYCKLVGLIFLVIVSCNLICAQIAPPTNLGIKPNLLYNSDVTYVGAFRVPQWNGSDSHSFAYAGHGLYYRASTNTLFAQGHTNSGLISEISIPAPKITNNINDLNISTYIQNFTDVLQGHRADIGGSYPKIWGLLIKESSLIVSVVDTYDASGSQQLSHFVTGVNFSSLPAIKGPFKVGSDGQSGMVAGYMAEIPVEWQSQLGGPALTGQTGAVSIITRTSNGPAASVFNPADLGVTIPAPATPLVRYPGGHWTLGEWNQSNELISASDAITGVAFLSGTNTVLFFGNHGTAFCYGDGTNNPNIPCYDPCSADHGQHGYPYNTMVWAYDANDLLKAKKGQSNPWDIVPYAHWHPELPFTNCMKSINGVAYDSANKRIFISAAKADGDLPLIHVFTHR